MTPDKIENANIIPGLPSVDMRINKDAQQQNGKKHKKRKQKKKIDPDLLLEEELGANPDQQHIDFHA